MYKNYLSNRYALIAAHVLPTIIQLAALATRLAALMETAHLVQDVMGVLAVAMTVMKWLAHVSYEHFP